MRSPNCYYKTKSICSRTKMKLTQVATVVYIWIIKKNDSNTIFVISYLKKEYLLIGCQHGKFPFIFPIFTFNFNISIGQRYGKIKIKLSKYRWKTRSINNGKKSSIARTIFEGKLCFYVEIFTSYKEQFILFWRNI